MLLPTKSLRQISTSLMLGLAISVSVAGCVEEDYGQFSEEYDEVVDGEYDAARIPCSTAADIGACTGSCEEGTHNWDDEENCKSICYDYPRCVPPPIN